jgi:hypothetical protein
LLDHQTARFARTVNLRGSRQSQNKQRLLIDCVLGEVGAELLGASTEWQTAAVGFVMSGCRSACLPAWNSLVPTRPILMKFGI